MLFKALPDALGLRRIVLAAFGELRQLPDDHTNRLPDRFVAEYLSQ
ncbi:hypothetical protein [Jeongeupia chitinilytica]|nr:hypothetical protein [Jeongeupia chitinilytica]